MNIILRTIGGAVLAASMFWPSSTTAVPQTPEDSYLLIQVMKELGMEVHVLRKAPDGTYLLSGRKIVPTGAVSPGTVDPPRLEIPVRWERGKLTIDPKYKRNLRAAAERKPGFRLVAAPRIQAKLKLPGVPTILKPDLKISEILFIPEKPKTGEKVLMEVYLENSGQLDAAFPADCPPVRVRYPDGAVFDDIPDGLKSIPAGGRGAVVFYLPAFSSKGTFSLRIEVDPERRIAESNETNNTFSAALTVQGNVIPSVNLKILQTRIVPEKPTTYTYYWEFQTEVGNDGPEAILDYQWDGLKLLKFSFPGRKDEDYSSGGFPLDPKMSMWRSAELWFAKSAPAGVYEGVLQIDPENKVVETNENDNSIPVSFRLYSEEEIKEKTDLEIGYIRLIPENPSKDDEVEVEVQVVNRGPFPARFDEEDHAWIALNEGLPYLQVYYWPKATETLVPAASRVFRQKVGKLDPGVYTMNLEINPHHWVTETDYADNVKTVAWTVTSKK